jgi:hypothetical protein
LKTVRICLLLLLAVLLPVRGTVAAVMLCPVPGSDQRTQARLHDHSTAHAPSQHAAGIDHSAHDHHGPDHASDPTGDGDGGSVGSADGCNLCSAFCSVPPLLDSRPTTFVLPEADSTPQPARSARAPSFFSDGPERPPRSI